VTYYIVDAVLQYAESREPSSLAVLVDRLTTNDGLISSVVPLTIHEEDAIII